MYEHITYDVLKDRMLQRIPDSFDKREGSMVYNTLAPVALVLSQFYQQLEAAVNNCYADTADMEALKRLAAPYGIIPAPATHAVLYAEFTPGDIDVTGRRFTCGQLSYVVTSYTNEGGYSACRVTCEQAGAVGNSNQIKPLIPVEYIEGLKTATLGEIVAIGEDEETLESFRSRVFSEPTAFGGNIADYKRVTLSIPGVTGVKVVPSDGAEWGTVGLYIQGQDYKEASAVLVADVEEYFSTYANGTGLAPIGHQVSVKPAEAVVVGVGLDLELADGYTREKVMPEITARIERYYYELRQSWGEQHYNEGITISVSRIYYEAMGVLGVKNATVYISGHTTNHVLAPLQIPYLTGGNYDA